jgi:hypothetical protein
MILDKVITPDGKCAEIIEETHGRALCRWGNHTEWFSTDALVPAYNTRELILEGIVSDNRIHMHSREY